MAAGLAMSSDYWKNKGLRGHLETCSPAASDAGRARHREVVEAFLRAARAGDLEGLLAVLDPDAVVRIDGAARIAAGAADAADTACELRGASTWAKQLIALSRGLRFVQPALINGSVGLMLDAAWRGSDAIDLLPRPSGFVPGAGWLVSQAVQIVWRKTGKQRIYEMVRRSLAWSRRSEYQMALQGL